MKFRAAYISGLVGILVLGILLFVLGASVPVHFRSLESRVVQLAGKETGLLTEEIEFHLNAGRVGPAKLLSTEAGIQLRGFQQSRIEALLSADPMLRITGGPAPYFEQFAREAGVEPRTHEFGFFYAILPSYRRSVLAEYLEVSTNSTVESLLDLRAVTGWQTFPPVFSAGGAPLETAILASALLVQGEDIPATVIRQLYILAERTLAEDAVSLAQLESFFLALQSIGRVADYSSARLLLQQFDDVGDVITFAELYREDPRKLSWLTALAVLADRPVEATRYLGTHRYEGEKALRLAMLNGRGAVNYVLDQGYPLYQPSPFASVLAPLTRHSLTPHFVELVLKAPVFAHVLRGILLILGGLLIMFFLLRLPGAFSEQRGKLPQGLLPRVGLLLSGCMLSGILWLLLEPNLLLFGQEKTETQFRLVFEAARELDLTKPQNVDSPMLDQVAIITLLIFFFLQLLVYIYCLMKIADIRREDSSPAVKIHLIENEDNLFDMGLYVGLGGTVLSLVMLQLDLINASLIAAYSSTLFGILFVAVLKIFHVRPYRRELILAHSK